MGSYRLSSLIALAAALAILMMGVSPARAVASDTQALPQQGVYEQCSLVAALDQCLNRLQKIRTAGFSVVLNYTLWYARAPQLRAYLDKAHDLGLHVIAPLNYKSWRTGAPSLKEAYPYLATTCHCKDDAGFLSYAIGL